MFGFGKEKTAEEEAEQRRIEAMKVSIESALLQMKKQAEAGLTDRCEAGAKRLNEALKNPKLPKEYAKQARDGVDRLLLHAFMKATALASKEAIDAGKSDDLEKRTAKIKEAREKLSGAMKYKAPQDFKQQCERMLEVAMMSGGVKAKGPTKAKPLDTAPKVENKAKPVDTAPPTPNKAKQPAKDKKRGVKPLHDYEKPVGV
ncbi:hypothetical protein NUH88_06415 [Nisaea acidiphila]|uniref:Uncharacterized protein n=1 Tax=Nisaea acidiphila TaxID=1862145 RepID=A0A9J7AYH7_9PROT|nr:hypothetical protein [Nisaea acidiphila]UUX51324.1 hypothetical protein NUH88_06415 [Nisaea acidiphila]